MKILFDQGTPVPLRSELPGHDVSAAYEIGWATLTNGELLRKAEDEFDVLITTDQNLPQQQDLEGISLAILILPTTSWPRLQQHLMRIRDALATIEPGQVVFMSFAE